MSSTGCLTCKESSRNSAATILEPEQVLISVWRQALVDDSNYVQIGDESYVPALQTVAVFNWLWLTSNFPL
jgi:hypothetical protein